jgi:hypothetical protein
VPSFLVDVAVRALAALVAASWIVVPGFGAPDLAVTWNEDWPQVLEAGWGLFATVIVGAAFVLVAVRPRASSRVAPQLVLAAVALALSAAIAREGRLLWFAAALALETAAVVALCRRIRPDGRPTGGRLDPSGPLLVLAVVGAGPWLAYALDLWALNRAELVDADLTLGIDHYSMQGALPLCLVLLSFLAALSSEARPFTPVCVGLAAAYLGLVSFAWQDAAGGFERSWSVAAVAWGVAVAVVPLRSVSGRERRDSNPRPPA